MLKYFQTGDFHTDSNHFGVEWLIEPSVDNTTVELEAPELEEDDIDSGIGVSAEDSLEVEAIFTL